MPCRCEPLSLDSDEGQRDAFPRLPRLSIIPFSDNHSSPSSSWQSRRSPWTGSQWRVWAYLLIISSLLEYPTTVVGLVKESASRSFAESDVSVVSLGRSIHHPNTLRSLHRINFVGCVSSLSKRRVLFPSRRETNSGMSTHDSFPKPRTLKNGEGWKLECATTQNETF